MTKTATIQARIDPKLKEKADVILHHIGLNASQAVNAFYAQIVLHNGLPFELKMPNEKTINAMNELEQDRGDTFVSFEEMLKDAEKKSA
ncbi:MAG: type II toxin-antitoxin system RelB/DinJ family antitoxin [Gammaproteobacteria bacterium]|nr:type II toxin-antitoxin system RelB/DinJ family antitoxin [Gammaproteobacteria bacterium]